MPVVLNDFCQLKSGKPMTFTTTFLFVLRLTCISRTFTQTHKQFKNVSRLKLSPSLFRCPCHLVTIGAVTYSLSSSQSNKCFVYTSFLSSSY